MLQLGLHAELVNLLCGNNGLYWSIGWLKTDIEAPSREKLAEACGFFISTG